MRRIRIVHGEVRIGDTCWWCERAATTSVEHAITLPPDAAETLLMGALGTALTASERRLPIPVPACDLHVGPMSAVAPHDARIRLVGASLALVALGAGVAVGANLGYWKTGVAVGIVLATVVAFVGELRRPAASAGLDFKYGKEPGKHPVLTSSEPDPGWVARRTPSTSSSAPYR